MSLGPKLEQIEGGDPTFRVMIEAKHGFTVTIPGAEILTSEEAGEIKMKLWRSGLLDNPYVAAICVVNERTGFTRDRISKG